MFNKKTVVIVGAGASKDFGLPTGAEVYSKLFKEGIKETSHEYMPHRDIFSGTFRNFLDYSNNHLLAQQLPRFIQSVKDDGVANSIDLFADLYPEFTTISKLYSTWSILGSMYSKKKPNHISRGYPTDYDPTYLSPSDLWLKSVIPKMRDQTEKPNWISALLRKHLEDIDLSEESKGNNLTIITFNYDTIIEDFFRKSIEKLPKYKHAVDIITPKVLHVYGSFKELNASPSVHDIFSHAENISYIHDANAETISDPFSEVKNEIDQAECIFIVGFDAAKENCARINLAQSKAHKFALNYDGNIGLNNRLEDVGVLPSNIMTGSLPKACSESFFHQADRLKAYDLKNL